MSDLHLTDEQLAELEGMGSLGEEAAYELRLRRKIGDGGCVPDDCNRVMDSWQRCVYVSSVDFFLYYKDYQKYVARNTAELRAALVYWTLKLPSIQHRPECQTIEEKSLYRLALETIAAITAALKEHRNE